MAQELRGDTFAIDCDNDKELLILKPIQELSVFEIPVNCMLYAFFY